MNSFWKRITSGERDAAIALAGIFLAIYLVILSVTAIIGLDEIGKAPEYPPSIPVSGKGEVVSISNIANFSYSVVESGNDVAEAQEKANTKNNAILEYLKGKGVEAKDIKTNSYNINPKYEHNPTNGRQTLTGYEVQISVSVKVRKAADAGEVLSQVGTWGVSYVSGLNFTVDDEDALKREARDLAIEDAKEQAHLLAKKLGVRLGNIISYYEESPYYPMPMYDSYGSMEKSAMMNDMVVPQIEAGEQKITSTVIISFELID